MTNVFVCWWHRWILWRAKRVENSPRFENRNGCMIARVVDVYDGDTFTVAFVHNGSVFRRRCRCIGYDSPEMKGQHADKPKAIEAREYLRSILPKGSFVLQYDGFDKYGRLLVTFNICREVLSDHMIRMQHGYAYTGGTKRTVQTEVIHS